MQKNIEYDEYLLHLSRYIHLNPLLAGIVKRLEDYNWSSYSEYINNTSSKICKKDLILSFFSGQRELAYKKFVETMKPDFSHIQNLILEDDLI